MTKHLCYRRVHNFGWRICQINVVSMIGGRNEDEVSTERDGDP